MQKNYGGGCSAFGCSMRAKTNLLSKVKMFHFPRDPVRRKAWSIALRRKNWIASNNSVVCNAHFITGKPSPDPKHPDYIPSQFSFNGNSLLSSKKKTSSCHIHHLGHGPTTHVTDAETPRKKTPLRRNAVSSSTHVTGTETPRKKTPLRRNAVSPPKRTSSAKSQKASVNASKKKKQKRKSYSDYKIFLQKKKEEAALSTNDDKNEKNPSLTDEQLNTEIIEVHPDILPNNVFDNFSEAVQSSYPEAEVLPEMKDKVTSDICASDEETDSSSRNESAEVLKHKLKKLLAVNEKLEKRLKESQMLCKQYVKENASLKEVIDNLKQIMAASNDN